LNLLTVLANGSAPAASRSSTTWTWPFHAAWCKGVHPCRNVKKGYLAGWRCLRASVEMKMVWKKSKIKPRD